MADAPGVAPPRSWRIAAVVRSRGSPCLPWCSRTGAGAGSGRPRSVALAADGRPGAAHRAAHLFGAAAGNAAATPVERGSATFACSVCSRQRDGKGYALFRQAPAGLARRCGKDIGAGVRLEAGAPRGVTLFEDGTRERSCSVRRWQEQALQRYDRRARSCGGLHYAAGIQRADRAAQCRAARRHDRRARHLEGAAADGSRCAGRARPERLRRHDEPQDRRPDRARERYRADDPGRHRVGRAAAAHEEPAGVGLGKRDGKPQQWLYLNAGACPS